jgi:DNA-binding transcriptional LysR family regulator
MARTGRPGLSRPQNCAAHVSSASVSASPAPDHQQPAGCCVRSWQSSPQYTDAVVTYDIGENFSGGITPICKVPAHALLRSDDPLAKKKAVKFEELSNRPFVLLDLPETRSYLIALFDLLAQRPVVALRTRSYETIRAAVSNSMGFSILNLKPSAEASLDGRELRRLPILDKLKQPTLIVVDPYQLISNGSSWPCITT